MANEWLTTFRPVLPVEVITLIAATLGVLAIATYFRCGQSVGFIRRSAMLVLRLVTITALTWMLAGPSVIDSVRQADVNVPLAILMDSSASMAQCDVQIGSDEPVSRWQALTQTWLDDANVRQLKQRAAIRWWRFDKEVSVASVNGLQSHQPIGTQTQLFDALQQVVGRNGNAALPPLCVVLSDGHDTQRMGDPTLMKQLRAAGVRVMVVPIGEVGSHPDLSVQAWAEADFLLEGQQTVLHADVHHRHLQGQRVKVSLLEQGRLVDHRVLTIEGDRPQRSSFTVKPSPPQQHGTVVCDYRVRAELVPVLGQPSIEEAFTENNERHVFVQMSRDKVRVALFEGEPYWDTRYLARQFRDDPQVELTAVYRFGSDRTVIVDDAEREIPVDVSAIDARLLGDFDVIVLGKHVEWLFPAERAKLLADYVSERGGAVVLARGLPFDRSTVEGEQAMAWFKPIAPVQWGQQQVRDLQLQLTEQGRRSPLLAFDDAGPADVIMTQLPGMVAATRVTQTQSASVVLLEQVPQSAQTPAMAAVVHHAVGRGQVMAVLTDGLWRWALLPGEQAAYRSVYHLFWARALRWLATGGEFLPGQDVTLTQDQLVVDPDEPVRFTAATRYPIAGPFEPVLRIHTPRGQVQLLAMQREDPNSRQYIATLKPDEPGVYRIELTDTAASPSLDPATPLQTQLAVYERGDERLDPSAQPQVLQALAQGTGGAVLRWDRPSDLLAHIEQVQTARLRDERWRYDFARAEVFALIVICLGLEWLLRRRGGLA